MSASARAALLGKTWLLIAVLSVGASDIPVQTARAAQPAEGIEMDSQRASGRFRIKRTEKCMMRKINGRRARNGLSRLDWDAHLIYVARRHASNMAANRVVYHDSSIGQRVTHWRRLGQNTGAGRRCKHLLKSFMHSSVHRTNILGAWRHFGVGVSRSGGRIYVQQIFESRLDPGNIYSYP